MGGENTEYGADQIQILEGLEAVRKMTGNVHWKYVKQGACIILYMKSWIMRWMKRWQDFVRKFR